MVFSAEQLINKSRQGDKEAFEELIKLYQKPVYTICYRYLGNHHDAFDATQETFLRLYNKLSLFDQSQSFSPWLYRIAVNIAKDLLKKKRPWEKLDLSLRSERGDPQSNLELTEVNIIHWLNYGYNLLSILINALNNSYATVIFLSTILLSMVSFVILLILLYTRRIHYEKV